MRTQEPGCFSNDQAREWVDELLESGDPGLIKDSIAAIVKTPDDDELDVTDCVRALAACEVIAAASDYPPDDMPKKLGRWLQENPQTFTKKLIDAAMRSLERIRTDSELKDIWEELDNRDEWIEVLDDLENRLESA